MTPIQCACPACRQPLLINQALPVQVRCPRCNAVFTLQPAPAAPPPPQPAAAPRGQAGLLLLLGGGAVCLLAVLVWALWPRGGDEPSAQGNPASGSLVGGPAAPPPLTPQQRKVKEATERGLAYLKERLAGGGDFYVFVNSRGGAHTGAVALAGLTLLECGVPASDPAVQKAVDHVRAAEPGLSFTYGVALCVLFLDRLGRAPGVRPDPADAERIRSMALRLIAGQGANGGWGYHCRPLDADQRQALLTRLKSGQFTPGSFPVPGQAGNWYDHSIGQFVTLALWAGRKHGVPVRPTLRAVAETYRAKQRDDGSWAYRVENAIFRDTGTCAALIGLAVGHAIDDEEGGDGKKGAPKGVPADLTKDPAVRRGLAHLGQAVGKKADLPEELRERRRQHTAAMEDVYRKLETAGPAERLALQAELTRLDKANEERGTLFDADAWGDLYFLWSVERMAVIYDLKQIEGKDWYDWGSEIILASQKRDGSWADRFPGVPDTCFALLFLQRVNVVKDLTDKLRLLRGQFAAAPGGGPAAPQPGRKD